MRAVNTVVPFKKAVDFEARVSDLSEDELLKLNKVLVRRLRALRSATAMKSVTNYEIGQTVYFRGKGGMFAPIIEAVIIKLNPTRVKAKCNATGMIWNVPPVFLRLTAEEAKKS